MDDEGPKYRLEHAANGQAVCTRAACKRDKVKIAKGELRIGTHSFFEPESRWYMAWRHWGCGTPHQIKGLKELTENDPTKAPGYDRLSPESQEQVRLSFEEEKVADKEFKSVREDLAKTAAKYSSEIRDAEGYAVSVATRAAACRGPDCLSQNTKITKDELRLGICVPFDGDHSSMKYKHWRCISDFDLEQIISLHKDELLDGIGALPEEYQQAVQATLDSGKVVDPPKIEPVKKPKKTRAKKKKIEEDDSEEEDQSVEDTPKPKRSRKEATKAKPLSDDDAGPVKKTRKTRAKKRKVEEDGSDEENQSFEEDTPKPKRSRKKATKAKLLSDEDTEPEYIPKKTRSRSAPMKDKAVPEAEEAGSGVETETQAAEEEEIDPAVQKIEAMAAAMREAEAHR